MSGFQLRWPQLPAELGDTMSRRADELYDVGDALLDDEGLIECAVLPLRDVVLYPNMVTPLFISDDSTLMAIEDSTRAGETMVAIAQHDAHVENPSPEDLHTFGTEVAVSRLLNIPDGTSSVLTQGRRRVEVVEFIDAGPYLRVRARPLDDSTPRTKETMALMRAVLTLFEKCVRLNRTLPEEAYVYSVNIEEPGWLADLITSALNLSMAERQEILETIDPVDRLQRVSILLGRELELLEIEENIHSRVQDEMDRSQREIYLREQIKAIQSELGEVDVWSQEVDELRKRVDGLGLPDDIRLRAQRELQRLTQMPAMSPEVGIIRTYLDWLLELPWSEATEDNLDVRHVRRVLNRNHYALKDAKDRILEYIAVRSLAPEKHRQPILCFVGPPGTGKTSLGRSISEALGRKFVRISLGGVRDEAEIRGHRRTYIGALPGRILQGMRRGGTVNPLFMLDEIDKLGLDFRGDPAAALLEVLDPEQNHAFSDHYLEADYDLSKVLFITTANAVDTVPAALLDRLEVIDFPGYIEEEKLEIAKRFLVPRQLEQNGVLEDPPSIPEGTIRSVIRQYTWEAGVRNLERELAKICRKLARRRAEGKSLPQRITPSMLPRFLGPPQIPPREAEAEDQVGAATVLAWTEAGGDTLSVEVLITEGKGALQITGQLGEVMQESAHAALSFIKSRARQLKIDPELFETHDIHIHIPEGSIPKDGPSAGITMATALASALTGRPVRRDVGMSGEITLRGRVLSIGGVREKILAGHRIRLGTIVLPAQNKKDLAEVPKKIRDELDLRFVKHMDQVLRLALMPAPAKKSIPAASSRRPADPRSAERPSASP